MEPGAQPTDSPEGGTDGRSGRRRWTSGLIVVVLLVHLALPLRYYLADTDERFCWRMFSTPQANWRDANIELRVTEVTVDKGGDPVVRAVPLQRHMPQPWIEAMRRRYRPVIDNYMRWHRERSDAPEIRFTHLVTSPDGRSTQRSLVLRQGSDVPVLDTPRAVER